jgi:prepilin-type N-terminal cleavage/methylation domain-containing protein
MKKAFTLVELLVAVLLLTLLIGTALFSYRFILLNIKKTQTSTFNEVLKIQQIRTSIESMQHYVVDKYNQFNQPMKKLHTFFIGEQDHCIYITLNPTFLTIPSIARLECLDNTLKYSEEPLYGRINLNQPKLLNDSQSKIYFEGIEECTFKYYLKHQELDSLKDTLPTLIHLSFYDKNKKKQDIVGSIKSDYNISNGVMYEYLYSE